LAAEKLENVK